MVKIDILTLFPEAFSALNTSILKRAQEKDIIQINLINIRDFSKNKHKKCDDTPFSGGAGMLMTVQPIYDAIMSVKQDNSVIIIPTPTGEVFNSKLSKSLSNYEHLIFVCGHYEGIDERVYEIFNPIQVSIGDYVLTGGEIPCMAIVDSLCRFIPGVLSKDSLNDESFSNDTLEYPQYTKPKNFMGYEVPEVLFSGNHAEIEKWKKMKSLEKTLKNRPDLIKKDTF
ncbi:MAG: tRNA (guanosine(37)-N1)-methyltransferase TrmD [Clostridia bacterium]|nr:tRNA (guanosine(37)-N1)-methyltransferase TrmD [Clostridia bacterium]